MAQADGPYTGSDVEWKLKTIETTTTEAHTGSPPAEADAETNTTFCDPKLKDSEGNDIPNIPATATAAPTAPAAGPGVSIKKYVIQVKIGAPL